MECRPAQHVWHQPRLAKTASWSPSCSIAYPNLMRSTSINKPFSDCLKHCSCGAPSIASATTRTRSSESLHGWLSHQFIYASCLVPWPSTLKCIRSCWGSPWPCDLSYGPTSYFKKTKLIQMALRCNQESCLTSRCGIRSNTYFASCYDLSFDGQPHGFHCAQPQRKSHEITSWWWRADFQMALSAAHSWDTWWGLQWGPSLSSQCPGLRREPEELSHSNHWHIYIYIGIFLPRLSISRKGAVAARIRCRLKLKD